MKAFGHVKNNMICTPPKVVLLYCTAIIRERALGSTVNVTLMQKWYDRGYNHCMWYEYYNYCHIIIIYWVVYQSLCFCNHHHPADLALYYIYSPKTGPFCHVPNQHTEFPSYKIYNDNTRQARVCICHEQTVNNDNTMCLCSTIDCW